MKFELDTFLPYLIHRVGPVVEGRFFKAMKSVGVTVEEWRVIATIYSQGPQSLNSLSNNTSIKLSTLSRLVGRLEKRGFISRKRVRTNNRAVEITLREKGRKVAQQMIPHCIQYEKDICAHFSASELASLRRLLPKLFDVLDGLTYDPKSVDAAFR